MNILFLTSTLPRYENDSQAPFVLEQACAWKEYRPEDVVYILAPHDAGAKKEEEVCGVHIFRFRYFWPDLLQALAYPAIYPNILRKPWLVVLVPFFVLSEFAAMLRLCRQKKIDFIFAHWIMPQGLVAYGISGLLKIPFGLKNYSSDLKVFRKIPWIGPRLAQRIIKRSCRMICENDRLKDEALDYFRLKEQARMNQRISVLSMGVFSTLPERDLTAGKDHSYTFGFIGRLSKKKGADHFIRALIQLQNRDVAFKAAIAGDGEERENLEKLCQSANIEFIGFVDGNRKAKFFDEVKFLIYPSVHVKGDVEGMPIAMLEALYWGKIIIASKDTNIQLLPEWEQVKQTVILLNNPADTNEFADKLQTLLRLSEEEMHARIQSAGEATKKFLWKNRIEEYADLLLR